ncbi:hypothetical protein ACJX0J_035762, partial [Zea mays]
STCLDPWVVGGDFNLIYKIHVGVIKREILHQFEVAQDFRLLSPMRWMGFIVSFWAAGQSSVRTFIESCAADLVLQSSVRTFIESCAADLVLAILGADFDQFISLPSAGASGGILWMLIISTCLDPWVVGGDFNLIYKIHVGVIKREILHQFEVAQDFRLLSPMRWMGFIVSFWAAGQGDPLSSMLFILVMDILGYSEKLQFLSHTIVADPMFGWKADLMTRATKGAFSTEDIVYNLFVNSNNLFVNLSNLFVNPNNLFVGVLDLLKLAILAFATAMLTKIGN